MDNKTTGDSSRRGSRILSDHRKVGKRFIPPWLQFTDWREIKWVDYVLPELLWLGLLNDYHGLAKGAALSLSLARAATSVTGRSPKRWFAPISAFASLTNEQKIEVIRLLKTSEDIESLREAIYPLVIFYPDCPLAFLFEDMTPTIDEHNEDLQRFKEFLDSLFNRWEKPATLVQANAVYIAFVTDLLKVFKGLALANFPAIADFPDTEESRRVAASIRATVNGFFGGIHYDQSARWPRYFWKRGLELEPCDCEGVYDGYG